MALQIKRGTNLQRLELLLAEGEPFYVTNAAALGVAPMWIGNGTTVGGVASMAPVVITELSDVEIITPAQSQVLQYDSSVGQWKNSSNLTIPGTTTLNGAAQTTTGLTSRITDTFGSDPAYPLAIEHIHSRTAAYTGIQTTSGDTLVSFASNPVIPTVGTRVKLSFVGGIGAMTGIAVGTIYYIYGIDYVASPPRFKLASTKANALAGIPLGTSGSCGAGTVTTFANIGFGIGLDRLVKMTDAASITAMRDNVIATNEAIGAESFKYELNLTQNGSAPGTPQLKVEGSGLVTLSALAATTATISGGVAITASTVSSTADTGALTVDGGVGINGALNVDGNLNVASIWTNSLNVTSTTDSTNTTSGALIVAGGVGIAKKLYVGAESVLGGSVALNSTTDSTTQNTGALIVKGGVGIAKNVYIGGYFRVLNQALIDNDLTVGGNLIVNGTTTTINSTTLTVDDKNIELGSVASPTDTTANGGGITLKNATSGDKTIAWYSASNNWEFSNGIIAPEATLGNIQIALSSNNNTITTSTGNLILDSATNIVNINADVAQTGNFAATGSIAAKFVVIDPVGSDGYITTSGGIDLALHSSTGIVRVNAAAILNDNVTIGGSNSHSVAFNARVNSDIIFRAITAGGPRGLRGQNGTSDYWFVGGGETASDAGYLELSTGDNGTEPIYVRQYVGQPTSGTLSRTAALLDGSGNTSFPGTLQVTGNSIKSSTGAAALELSDINVKVNGELTVAGNKIRSSGGSAFPAGDIAITLSGANVVTAGTLTSTGDLTVNGTTATFNSVDINGTLLDGVTLENAFIFTWDETNNRLNRPVFQASSGNTSGVRLKAPNATSAASSRISVGNSNDDDNNKFVALFAGNSTNPLRIITGETVSGVQGNTSESLTFTKADGTIYAGINPAGTTISTDVATKTYTDTAIATSVNALHIGTSNLTTSSTANNQILDIVSMSAFRTVKYIIQVTSAGSGSHVMECLVMHDNTTAYITTYGEMFSSVSLTSISVTVSGSDMHLLVTPTNAVTSYKVTKTSITA